MAIQQAVGPATVTTVREPGNGEQSAALNCFDIATLIALQSKKLAHRFRLTDAAAKALAPIVFGEAAR
jgi:hypothetical protein